MSGTKRLLFSALLASLSAGAAVHAAEFEVLDRFSVDGYSVFRGSTDIPGGSLAVGGSAFVVKDGNVGIGTASPGYKLVVNDSDTSHFGIAEFLGGAVSGSYRYSQLYFGQTLVAGQSSNIGYMTHQTDTSLSGLYFTNYGEGEGTSGIFIKRGGNVGIGTTAPGQKLSVAGTIESTSGGIKFPDGTVQTSAVPSGAVMFFNLASCPTGWSALAASQGRYLVSLPAGGTLGGTGGAALGNLEDRPVGQHNHAVSDAGHNHTLTLYEWTMPSVGGGYLAYTRNSNANNGAQGATPGNQSATTGISINNTG